MNPAKLSMIASLIGVSVGLQEVNNALEMSEHLRFEQSNYQYYRGILSDRPVCVPGFPDISEDFDEFEFKIFRGHARAWGFKETKLIVLAYDKDQGQRLVDLFTTEYNKATQAKRPSENGAVSHMFEEELSPDEVIKHASSTEIVYTLFTEKIFTGKSRGQPA